MQQPRIQVLRAFAGAAIAVVLAATLSSVTSSPIYAQSPSLVSGQPPASTASSCADGDSWCAYCMNNASANLCQQVPPSIMASGGNLPVQAAPVPQTTPSLGMGMGMVVSGSTAGMGWMWCTAASGGAGWIPVGLPAAGWLC